MEQGILEMEIEMAKEIGWNGIKFRKLSLIMYELEKCILNKEKKMKESGRIMKTNILHQFYAAFKNMNFFMFH